MKRLSLLTLAVLCLGVGKMPVPDISDVEVNTSLNHSEIEHDGDAYQIFTFEYSFVRSSSSEGEITGVSIALWEEPPFEREYILPPPNHEFVVDRFPVERSYEEARQRATERISMHPKEIVEFGVPEAFDQVNGNVTGYGFTLSPNDERAITPGNTVTPVALESSGLPRIVTMSVRPFWQYVTSRDEWDPDKQHRAREIKEEISQERRVIGPSKIEWGSFAHWDQLEGDMREAVDLGWADPGLVDDWLQILSGARTIVEGESPWQAESDLTRLIEAARSAREGGSIDEAFSMLVEHNALALIESLPEEPEPPFEPKIEVEPTYQEHTVNQNAQFTGRVYNIGDDDAPVTGFPVEMEVISGPHEGYRFGTYTDFNGEFSLGYHGQQLGLDRVIFHQQEILESLPISEPRLDRHVAWANVLWDGIPDLTLQEFVPPFIRWDGESEILLTETTLNRSQVSVPSSTTRYYLSSDEEMEPYRGQFLGEREVPALDPQETSSNNGVYFELPDGLSEGDYYLQACTDAEQEISESNEDNNCEAIQAVMAMERAPEPEPDCALVDPSEKLLWPPNHRMSAVSLRVSDESEYAPERIEVNGILQDEPLNARGDGNFEPDARIQAGRDFSVRAERSGRKDGRLYFVQFEGHLGDRTCSGEVVLGVPHDRGGQSLPEDSGERYNSVTGERIE